MINEFRGKYYFLSNFFEAPIAWDGIVYQNNEAAFQSAKVLDKSVREKFSTLDPASAKRNGRNVQLRHDWENIKYDIMYEICLAKFSQNEELKTKLLETEDQYLEEGNTWGDKIWGTVNGVGENRLGKILMRVREELRMNNFDAVKVKNDLIKWITDWFSLNGQNCKAVIGISGGLDSTVVAALCKEALGKDRVIGVLMPNGIQRDICFADMVCDHLGIKKYEINIKDMYNDVYMGVQLSGIRTSDQARINIAPRLRMTVLFAVAQSLNGRVSCNSNLSETYIGYSTIFGDSAGSFAPLKNLTKTEVKLIAKELGLPSMLIEKEPSDGLCGKTDEDNFGFTYSVLDKYIRTGEIDDLNVKEKIDRLHELNMFKTQPISSFPYKEKGD